MSKIKILFEIALRNLFASKINLVIGVIVLAGTVLVVVGGALLDSVDTSMSKSIKGSVAGDLQVYSAKSKDELATHEVEARDLQRRIPLAGDPTQRRDLQLELDVLQTRLRVNRAAVYSAERLQPLFDRFLPSKPFATVTLIALLVMLLR